MAVVSGVQAALEAMLLGLGALPGKSPPGWVEQDSEHGGMGRTLGCQVLVPSISALCSHQLAEGDPLMRTFQGRDVFTCKVGSWWGHRKSGCEVKSLRSGIEWAMQLTPSFLPLAHTPTTPSATNQAAVPVPATLGCCPGQHSLTCLQPFPVPHICASHDSHPRASHHVRTDQGLAPWRAVGPRLRSGLFCSPCPPSSGPPWCAPGNGGLMRMNGRTSLMCSKGRWLD